MKRDKTNRIKRFTVDAQKSESLRKRLPLSAHPLSACDRQVIGCLNLQANGVMHIISIHAVSKTSPLTPPQIDTCKCKDTRSKTRVDVVESWRRKAQKYPFKFATNLIYISKYKSISLITLGCYRVTRVRRYGHLTTLLVFEGDQKKDGKRPAPGKPAKPEQEKPKPEREGDKGKRKGKSPRTEQLVS